MGLLRIIFRKNDQVFLETTQSSRVKTPISSIRRKYLLLGEVYSVELCQGIRNSLKIDGDTLFVTLREMTAENYEEFMEGWYRRTARKIFQRVIDQLDIDGIAPQIKLFKMRRAWGRCYYQKRVITLNIYLIKTPIRCIEYIILHELCHFTHQNHGRDFQDLVAYRDPDWKEKDKFLKELTRTQRGFFDKFHI